MKINQLFIVISFISLFLLGCPDTNSTNIKIIQIPIEFQGDWYNRIIPDHQSKEIICRISDDKLIFYDNWFIKNNNNEIVRQIPLNIEYSCTHIIEPTEYHGTRLIFKIPNMDYDIIIAASSNGISATFFQAGTYINSVNDPTVPIIVRGSLPMQRNE
jgi:hypothetical protein